MENKDDKLNDIIKGIREAFPDSKIIVKKISKDDFNLVADGEKKKLLDDLFEFFKSRGIDEIGQSIRTLIDYATYMYMGTMGYMENKEEAKEEYFNILKYSASTVNALMDTMDKKKIDADPVMVLLHAAGLFMEAIERAPKEEKVDPEISELVNKLKNAGLSVDDIKKYFDK